VRADEDQVRALGITGMPFCAVESGYAVSGAQPAQTFTQALEQAWGSR
jgi:predicted DsbA family dithiol-disulfide isomerase